MGGAPETEVVKWLVSRRWEIQWKGRQGPMGEEGDTDNPYSGVPDIQTPEEGAGGETCDRYMEEAGESIQMGGSTQTW